MKKVLVLLLAFSFGAMQGVCSCQRPRPVQKPAEGQQQQQPVKGEQPKPAAEAPVKK